MTSSAPSTQLLQSISLDTAHAFGDPIHPDDFALAQETLDIPLLEVAQALGRSYHATTTIRYRARHGIALRPQRVAASDRPYVGFMIGDDEGW